MTTNGTLIDELLSKDLDDLYEMLGRELSGRQVTPSPRYKAIEFAQNWIRANRDRFADLICGNENIRQLYEDPRGYQRVTAIAVIADLITDTAFGVAPLTVAVVLVKEGLDTLCHSRWCKTES